MRKVIKIGFPILCVAVIGGTFILLNKTTEKINRNRLPEEDDEIIVVENQNNEVSNGLISNTIGNVLSPEGVKEQEVKNKAKAIEIVKKLAPPTSSSYYTNEGMVGENYLVAVRDNVSKDVSIYYTADIVNEKIEIYVK